MAPGISSLIENSIEQSVQVWLVVGWFALQSGHVRLFFLMISLLGYGIWVSYPVNNSCFSGIPHIKRTACSEEDISSKVIVSSE